MVTYLKSSYNPINFLQKNYGTNQLKGKHNTRGKRVCFRVTTQNTCVCVRFLVRIYMLLHVCPSLRVTVTIQYILYT